MPNPQGPPAAASAERLSAKADGAEPSAALLQELWSTAAAFNSDTLGLTVIRRSLTRVLYVVRAA